MHALKWQGIFGSESLFAEDITTLHELYKLMREIMPETFGNPCIQLVSGPVKDEMPEERAKFFLAWVQNAQTHRAFGFIRSISCFYRVMLLAKLEFCIHNVTAEWEYEMETGRLVRPKTMLCATFN